MWQSDRVLRYVFVGLLVLAPNHGAAQELTKVTFHLQWLASGYHAAFYAAVEKGWYKDAGLDVTIEQGKGSYEAIRMVGLGQVELGIADGALMAKSVSEGVPVRMVAMIMQDTPLLFMAFADTGIKAPRDLEGHSLGVVRESPDILIGSALFKKNDIDINKIDVVNYNYATQVASFLAGKVDASTGYAYNELLSAQTGAEGRAIHVMPYRDYGIQLYSAGIIVNNEFMEANPKVLEAFVQVSMRALQWSIENVDEAVEIVKKHSETPPARLKGQLEASIPYMLNDYAKSHGLGSMSAEKWEQTQSLMVEYGGQKAKAPVDQVYTDRFLE